jgi:hypothetical protein
VYCSSLSISHGVCVRKDETRSEVQKSGHEKNVAKDCFISRTCGQLGSRRSCLLHRQLDCFLTRERGNHVSLNASHKQTVRGCPPFKSFDSLRRCVYASSPYQRPPLHHCLYYQTLLTPSRPYLHSNKQPHHLPRVHPSKQELFHDQAETRQHKAKMFVYKRGMYILITRAVSARAWESMGTRQRSLPP